MGQAWPGRLVVGSTMDPKNIVPEYINELELNVPCNKQEGSETDASRHIGNELNDEGRTGATQASGDDTTHQTFSDLNECCQLWQGLWPELGSDNTHAPNLVDDEAAPAHTGGFTVNFLHEAPIGGKDSEYSKRPFSTASKINPAHKVDEQISAHIRRIKEFWPTPDAHARQSFPKFCKIYDMVKARVLPNYLGARIPVESGLHIHVWRDMLKDYHDIELCEYLEFGWPIGYHANDPPQTTFANHPSAQEHGKHIKDFLSKELGLKAILGPFVDNPFQPWTRRSPIMTRPKSGSEERRIILDLSFPEGRAVNDGICIDNHFGKSITYTLPTINDFINRLVKEGRNAYMWKLDLTRAYRQLRVNPLILPFWVWGSTKRCFWTCVPPLAVTRRQPSVRRWQMRSCISWPRRMDM